ncbi:MAG TPA: GNAT family N-acetyltransferase [Burkholderiaceae bacterium]|nr:GNAT family N-acetyltransferase [Burkholderiaceae bacterium]
MRDSLGFEPLTPDRWPDLVQLFGPNGACGGCWCMWWKRSPEEFRQKKGTANRRSFKALVDRGDVPGFLAYEREQPIGWCAVEPRPRYPRLASSRALVPVDQEAVWSVTCVFVKAGHRRAGLSLAMLEHAKRFVAERGGRLLEGYPKDSPSGFQGANSMWTGVATTFLKAGFTEIARRTPTRPIMRFELRSRY